MATLKMVAGKTYMCPPIFGAERVISRGEVVEVETEQHVKVLLDETYTDALNNTHYYFEEFDGGAEVAADDEDGEEKPAAKPATRTRTKK